MRELVDRVDRYKHRDRNVALLGLLTTGLMDRWDYVVEQLERSLSFFGANNSTYVLFRAYAYYKGGKPLMTLRLLDSSIGGRAIAEVAAFVRGLALMQLNRYLEALVAFDRYDFFANANLTDEELTITQMWANRIINMTGTSDEQVNEQVSHTFGAMLDIKPVDKVSSIKLHRSAKKALKRLEFKNSLELYDLAISHDYENSELWYERGRILIDLKKDEEAMVSFLRAQLFGDDSYLCKALIAISRQNFTIFSCPQCMDRTNRMVDNWSNLEFCVLGRLPTVGKPTSIEPEVEDFFNEESTDLAIDSLVANHTYQRLNHFLIPSKECLDVVVLNQDYQILIDCCIRNGERYGTAVKMIAYLPEVVDFALAEWIYIAEKLKFRTIWIVPAWIRYTVRKRFNVHRWMPSENQLTIYVITQKLLFNHSFDYWVNDEKDALGLLDLARDYGGMFNVFMITRKSYLHEWDAEKLWKNYSKKEVIEAGMNY